jgi:hypothetical protein
MHRRLLVPWLLLLSACPVESTPSSDAQDAESDASAQTESDASVQTENDAAEDALDAGATDAGAQRDAGDQPDAAHDAAAHKPALAELMEQYRSWSPRQAMPQSISTQIFTLCRLPTSAEQMFTESEHGEYRYLQDWLNPAAEETFESKDTPFPVGAAIVKEKLLHADAGAIAVVARGLMIKRAPGFDPEHGDWEFGYWEPDAGLASGRETARPCGGCHAGAPTDFVFLDQSWRLGI